MKKALSLGILAAAILWGQTRDITGTWVAKTPGQNGNGETELTWDLKVDPNGKITGSQKLGGGESPITDGKITGDKVELTVEITGFDGSVTKATATGTLVADELRITPASAPGGRGGRGGGRGGAPAALVVAHNTTPSYKAAEVDYKTLPKVDLPAVKDLGGNHLAQTPPMGWNSWNRFHAHIDGRIVRETADAMVASGMKTAGYQYINIDDGWQGKRDASGRLQPNPNFPNMKALADYVHSKGLKLGIYSSPGPRTCGGFEGSYGHEELDAQTWAEWGVDYLKYDWCSASQVWKDTDMRAAYQKMAEALRKTGRPIVYSLCQYGRAGVGEWGAMAGGNLWRTTSDIRDTWQSMSDIGFAQGDAAKFTKPGWWPDADMLEIGNGGMNVAEYRTHLSLWAMIGAPLIAGNDLRDMKPEIKDLLTNRDVIAVDQDKLGKGGQKVSADGSTEIWARQLEGGAWAVALFNRGEAEAPVTVKWAALHVAGAPVLRDLWAHADVKSQGDGYQAKVPAHGVVMLRVKAGK